MTEPTDRAPLITAITKRFPDRAQTLIALARWDPLDRCWHVDVNGMWIGIEPDGYLHS